jgi:hypothetical protein
MLKENLTPNSIYTIKLVSGEELLAKLISSDMMGYVVSKPLVCVISHQGMGLTQWMLTASMDQYINLPNTSVLAISKTRKDIADQYIESTTSIKPASASILQQ